MIHMEGEVVIRRPVELVFDFVADACNEPRYNRNIIEAEKVSSGPVGRGARFRNKTRSMGRTTEWTIDITGYERPRRLGTALRSAAMDIRGEMSFGRVADGTRMKWSWDLMPRGIFKLLAPLVKLGGQRLEENNWDNLKRYLEDGGAGEE